MTSIIFVSFAFGIGIYTFIVGFFPARPPLADAMNSLHRSRTSASVVVSSQDDSFVVRVLGRRFMRTGIGERLLSASGKSLRILNRRPEEYAGRVAASLLVPLILPLILSSMFALVGAEVSFTTPIFTGLIGAAIGLIANTASLRSAAQERRESFRHALGAFLDVVAVSLASGKGVDSALQTAADIGHGWAFAEIRRALLGARLAGETPWVALGRLGDELSISELNELAASTSLAGDEGAKVKQSLLAKSRSVRTRGMALAQSYAEASTERMAIPTVMLMVGFMLFLGYPAVDSVMNGIGGN